MTLLEIDATSTVERAAGTVSIAGDAGMVEQYAHRGSPASSAPSLVRVPAELLIRTRETGENPGLVIAGPSHGFVDAFRAMSAMVRLLVDGEPQLAAEWGAVLDNQAVA